MKPALRAKPAQKSLFYLALSDMARAVRPQEPGAVD